MWKYGAVQGLSKIYRIVVMFDIKADSLCEWAVKAFTRIISKDE